MERWGSAEEILDFAVKQEERAAKFYGDLAKKVGDSPMRSVFEEFAREEIGHKAKLLAVKSQGSFTPRPQKVADLKIADYLADVDQNEELDYQSALILAMKREKAAFRLYTRLAEMAEDADLKAVMLALAQEEAKHKLRFEMEYDEDVLREN